MTPDVWAEFLTLIKEMRGVQAEYERTVDSKKRKRKRVLELRVDETIRRIEAATTAPQGGEQ